MGQEDYIDLYFWGLQDLKTTKDEKIFCAPYSKRIILPPQLDMNSRTTKAVIVVADTAKSAGKAATGITVFLNQVL